jgi:hypothetical protein
MPCPRRAQSLFIKGIYPDKEASVSEFLDFLYDFLKFN